MQLAIGIACLALVVLLVRGARPSAAGPIRQFISSESGATLVALAATAFLALGIALTLAGIVAIGG